MVVYCRMCRFALRIDGHPRLWFCGWTSLQQTLAMVSVDACRSEGEDESNSRRPGSYSPCSIWPVRRQLVWVDGTGRSIGASFGKLAAKNSGERQWRPSACKSSKLIGIFVRLHQEWKCNHGVGRWLLASREHKSRGCWSV